ncbi:MAG: hypothetical protein ACLSVD_06675 [Eggerthellaceae bacterium]
MAVVDSDGTVVASFTAAKQFGMVLATSPRSSKAARIRWSSEAP